MIGKTISHYRILDRLGEGGMGVVYKAEDLRLKRIVALKFLPRKTLASQDAKARLLHEAQAAAALDHQNICTIYEIDEADGHIFIVMALVEGESVAEKIASGPLTLTDVLGIAKQTGDGLAVAHKRGIIHRDIKPANLMVSENGQVKIMDFGLAHTEGQTRLTKTGVSVGTITYMSPEQARGDEIDHRTDIWSFGVSLYEMISGRRPFRGEHEQAVLYSVLNEDPEPLTAVRTGVPVELERLVNKAMAKRPEDRYQHLDDLLVDLKAIEKQLVASAGSTHVRGTTGAARVGGKPGGKRPGVIAVSVVFTAVIIFVILVLPHLRERPPDQETQTTDKRESHSLAVLPFDNLMNDPTQDYFVDGMHDALITSLSKLGSLRVISRTSMMRYKNTEKTIPEIARELDVDVLVEGSVLRVGDEVKITAQLIDGVTDKHLWADDYVRDLQNVFSLLNDVAGAIAGKIRATLTPAQEERLARTRAVDPDAYEAFLRGKQLFYTFKPKSVRESIGFVDKAIAIDPEFAEAYAIKAGAYIVLTIFGAKPAEFMEKAREAAQKALELDDSLPDAHAAAGYILLYFDQDWEAGGTAFRRALEIDPNNSMARHGYADYLTAMGRVDESVDEVIRGRQADPLSPMTNAVVVGHLYLARRYDEVIAEAKKLLAINPEYPNVQAFLRRAYWHQGKLEESIELLRESGWGRNPENRAVIDRGYASDGPKGVMLALAQHFEAESGSAITDPLSVAIFYGLAGRMESAMDWLEKAEEARSPTFIHALLTPAFDPVRDTPRFKALRRRLNLPD